jgi:hypothetical protein
MSDLMIVKLDGVQRGKTEAPPTPFDFKRSILNGGAFDANIARAVIDLSMKDAFPLPSGDSIFDWDALMPHEAISFVAIYDSLNKTMNKNAIKEGKGFLPVTDAQVKERVDRQGLMSPKEIEKKFAKNAMRPQI